MDFSNAKEMQDHAMKCRYGWKRFFFFGVDGDIREDVQSTIVRVTNKEGEFDEHQARLDFVRKYPIED